MVRRHIVSFVGVLVLLTAGCNKQTDPNTTAYWIERLESEDQRVEALRELAKRRDPAAREAVLRWLQEPGEWQPDAAYTLGQLGDKSVAPALVARLDYTAGPAADAATRLRHRTNVNIVRALGALRAPEGVEPLLTLVRSGAPTTREAALRSLGAIKDARATTPLVQIALNETQPFLRKLAIIALGNLGDPKATDALIQNLYVELPGVSFYHESRHALIQLGRVTIPALMKVLKRQDPNVENIVLSDGSPIAEGAIEAKAASVLGALRARKAELPIADNLSKFYQRYQARDTEPVYASVPAAVIEMSLALANLGGSSKTLAVLSQVVMDEDARIRSAAAEALAAIGDRAAVRPLLRAARKGDRDARQAAIVAISRLGTQSDLAAYDALAKAGDGQVSADVMRTMVESERLRLSAAQTCGREVACWQQQITHPEPRVRERAAYELGRIARSKTRGIADGQPDSNAESNASAITTALLKAAGDDDASVRMAALYGLAELPDLDTAQLEAIARASQSNVQYAGVNEELKRMIAWRKSQDSAAQ